MILLTLWLISLLRRNARLNEQYRQLCLAHAKAMDALAWEREMRDARGW